MKKPYAIRHGKQIWRNHLRYDWWKYIIFMAGAALLWSMVSAALTKVPADKSVVIYLISDYADTVGLEDLSKEMLTDFPELQEINFINIPTANQDDYAAQERLVVYIAAKQGNLFIGSEEEMAALAQQGLFDPMETDWADNILSAYVPEADLGLYLDSTESESTSHYYGIPVDKMQILQEYYYAPEHKVMGVPFYSLNKEKTLQVVAWLYEHGIDAQD
jgi:hypothetical protein